MVALKRHITLIIFLLLLGSVANQAWAAKVTYHVLTLPIDASSAHMVDAVDGKRLEAVRAIVDNATTIELPAHFKSPLATNFKYYKADQVEASAATYLHSGSTRVRGIIYNLKAGAVETAEGAEVTSNCDIYVTYDYLYADNETANPIAKLDGSVIYNIGVKKGFLALNRGRNNRPAVVPKSMVGDAHLISEDFVKMDVTGSGITTYWSSGDNKNPQASVGSQFHFQFKLEGNDPYNIIIRTAYDRDSTYMEKEGNGVLHIKYYKESSIFTPSTNNAYLASDEHREYTVVYDAATYPTYASFPVGGLTWTDTPGFFHRQGGPIWSTFALLNNTTGDGYVFMGSRTYNNDGTFSNPGGSNNNYQYKYLKFDAGNLTINNQTPAQATTNYSTDQKFYEIKTVTFKVKTPFGNTVSADVRMSEYKILNDDIAMSDIPASLERKYCTFTRFYDDAAHTREITKYSDMTGYDIYVAYEVSASIPFKAITHADSYTADTWKTATWYELTDDGSTEESGKKLKYDGTSTFKNNGAHNEFTKTSEYAFIGDPYELQVVLRSATSGATPSYVGAASEGNLGISTVDGAGYHWEMPDDDTAGSFLLRRFGGGGHWKWETGNISQDIAYTTKAHTCNVTYSNAQTLTFNISGLTVADGNYFKVTAGGTDAAQVISTTPALSSGIGGVASDGTATVTATIAANSETSKTFTLTIQEYNSSDAAVGAPSVITINQGTTAYAGSTVEYSATASTRVKAMELSNAKYTYKIVDKAGRIAVTATTTQPIYSPLSIATIPSVIVSPFIVDETVTFYSTYTGGGRGNLSGEITEAPEVDDPETGAVIYVKYTTTKLDEKPFNLSEDQEIFVRLNGQYIYYDNGTLKSTENSGAGDEYKWKLRNLDPYAMLLDNLGARTALGASGSESVTVPTDNDGTTGSVSRQVGAWVKLADDVADGVALTFDIVRANAQPFIAKSSARAGVYEVMVATGDGVNASITYYNIGRPDATTVKIYSNATYQAGDDDEIKFRLEENTTYTYHLIDKSKHDLLTASSKSPELVLPAEYQSPLVGRYHYYDITNFNVSEGVYTLKASPTELTNILSLQASYIKTSSDAATYDALDESNKLTASSVDDMESEAKKYTSTGHYYYKVGDDYYDVNVTKACYTDIYVTYEKNDLVTFNSNGHPYLLKFLQPLAEGYFLEDGNDKLTTSKIQAVYPYCNGDGNLNIYGTAMNEEQMNGGANTRPRWIWYFNNPTGYTDDPYHVTIRSRSTITYNGVGHPTYLKTYAVHFNQDADANTKHIVTRGALPGIASEDPTEYMILGTQGNYRLVTTNAIALDLNGDGDTNDEGESNERRTVTSFEQYWKTYNMVKLDVLGILASTNAFSEDASTWVVPTVDNPETTDVDESTYRATLAARGWHSYAVYANATRWNGYNDKEEDGVGKKVVEYLEHWFQTFDMGTGAFDIESADIPPVLVLLDRHGWEIMRKPLPTKSTYPNGEELNALRAYDSPMVKEYKFYNNATKASGCHKYSLRTQNGALRDEIKVSGTAYTSTSLATLPPINATGVMDNSGFIQDFYVTYTVKEEYEKSYDPSTDTRSKFLVLQNSRFLKKKNTDDTPSYISKPIYEHTNPEGGNVYDLILSPKNNTVTILDTSGNIADYNFWYVGPNTAIDTEMGYPGTAITYTDAENGFDPYNIQIKNVGENKFLTSNMTSSTLEGGAMVGGYSTDGVITMEDATTSTISSEGYDHSTLAITNQTFMAVQDVNGNMQLMPRFDHTKRINTSKASPYLTTLEDAEDHTQTATADNNSSMGPQTTFLVRPQIMEYLIVDNQGREALRYKRAGDYYPTITEHFKSPLATDFKYYKTLPDENEDGVYELEDIADEITGSFADAGLNGKDVTVYVRYSYNESLDTDGEQILQGKWFTMKLNSLDVEASGTINTSDGTGVSLFADDTETPTKPGTVDADDKTWQWKFLKAPADPSSAYYTAPDPYAIELYNRNANYSSTLAEPSPMSVPIKVNGEDRFSLLSHPSGGYALAVNGLKSYSYDFLNGTSMTTSVAATTAAEAGFTNKANTISAGSQLIINDDVTHTYNYRVITNGKALAASADQTNAEAVGNNFAPYVPSEIQSPLLNEETDYLYYGSATESTGTYTVVPATKLFTLYGLYDDVVYVRYEAFDRDKTPYYVPNVRNSTGTGTVAIGSASNDVAFDLSGNLPYNIIWLNDNMMTSSDGSAISDGGSHALDGGNAYVWKFENNDPYAIYIRHKGDDGKYADGTGTLNATAKPFMLLKKEGYDYGVLQETGGVKKLTDYGETLTADGSTAPTKFIPFALSVHKLIYHLVIKNTGNSTDIPYREGTETSYLDEGWKTYAEASPNTETIPGTTQRNLSTHPIADVDAGQVSLGDDLEEPSTFYRPNCNFYYYIEGVYNDNACNTPNATLNNRFKGLKLTKLMSDAALIGTTVKVNVTYGFNTGLETNAGKGFVTDVDDNLWYTYEAKATTPKLAQYTSSLQTVSGYATHYTNDYLWTPLGDPYGFKMYNRYMYKNQGETSTVMTTSEFDEGIDIVMSSSYTANSVYELLADGLTTPGYFYVHPVANNAGTQYYMRDNNGTMQLSTTRTEWTYGLSEDVMRPYYDRAGYVGGLNAAGKAAYETALAIENDFQKLVALQGVVYNHDKADNDASNYIVHYTPGYYRLHNQPGSESLSTLRYASGYLHDIEKTAGESSTAIPMHFYSRAGITGTFDGDTYPLESGFTETNATRGDIPIPATEYDPSTIFYFSGSSPSINISTQGLNVLGNKMTTSTGTAFTLTDIGGAIVALNGSGPTYLRYDQSDADHIYDLSYTTTGDESARWCMKPVQKTATAGNGEMPLKVTMNNGGDGYYYATFCAPFDVLLTDGESYAYVCTEWNTTGIHPAKVPAVGETYAAGKFVPAGTPVIFRTTDNSGSISLTLPNSSPTSAVTSIFTGKYLEQMLVADASHDVYTFGLPFTSTVTIDRTDGSITAPLIEQATTGVGFYINATPNKENDPLQSNWNRNNLYVLHNKIYYRGGSSSGASAPSKRAIEFVPVIFDDEEGDEEISDKTEQVFDGRVYNLQGRCVATEEQVKDGTWQDGLATGIYIINGKKLVITRK
ncbi:MAG: hypothetical protein E7106_06090 [Prevotella sp.]|nr:hypothetical protein [Prevotella sp.]